MVDENNTNNGTAPNEQQSSGTSGIATAQQILTGHQGAFIGAVETTKIKLPDFHEEHTDLWFWQVEAAFDSANITSDKKKYNTIIGQLPTKIMCKLVELRTNPPAQGQMYKTLKERIIQEFADSTQTKITKILNEMSLGDKKPSTLLAEMRAKAQGTGITDDLLKSLWNNHLPEQIRTILASGQNDLTLATMSSIADRIWEELHSRKQEVNQLSALFPTAGKVTLETMQSQINQLFEMIKNNNQHQRSRSSNRSNSHQRSNTPSQSQAQNSAKQQRFDTCWWHFKFGAEAKKCKQPCNFHTQKSSNPSSGN